MTGQQKKGGDKVEQVVLVKTYEEVLLKTRDLIHTIHKLLTPSAGISLKPSQTPYRTILYTMKPEKK